MKDGYILITIILWVIFFVFFAATFTGVSRSMNTTYVPAKLVRVLTYWSGISFAVAMGVTLYLIHLVPSCLQ